MPLCRFPALVRHAERRDTPVRITAPPARMRHLSRSLTNIRNCGLPLRPRIDLHQRDRPPLPAALVRLGTARSTLQKRLQPRKQFCVLCPVHIVFLTITLLAFSSAALAQQQQCQLECTVTQNGKTRVTRSCHALDAEQCALVAKADTGGPQTCRGYLTTNCVNDR
jgi:hypothetical protein